MFKKLNLFSKTEMKVLVFISAKDGELYERQIADGAGVSIGSANSILKAFSKIGLVNKSKKGKMSFYRRNDDNPLLRQFKIFITVNNLIPLLEKLIPISIKVILFGSCATGRNDETSDIDLFVLTRENDEVVKILGEFPHVQSLIFNNIEYATLEKKDRPLYDRIIAGIELYGGEHG